MTADTGRQLQTQTSWTGTPFIHIHPNPSIHGKQKSKYSPRSGVGSRTRHAYIYIFSINMFHSRTTSLDGLVCPRSGSRTPDSNMAGPGNTELEYRQYVGLPSASVASISYSTDTSSTDWLYQLLTAAQLEQFYVRIRDQLQVSRLEHFEYVTCQDLEKVGLARPAARRLIDLIKKRRRRAIVDKFIPSPLQNRLSGTFKSKSASTYSSNVSSLKDGIRNQPPLSLTCLIQDKDICLQGKYHYST